MSSKWTISRKAKSKVAKYPYNVKLRCGTNNHNNITALRIEGSTSGSTSKLYRVHCMSASFAVLDDSDECLASVNVDNEVRCDLEESVIVPGDEVRSDLEESCNIVNSDEHQVHSGGSVKPNSAQFQLQQWAVSSQIAHTSLNFLLAILRQYLKVIT